jgi:serine/threonine protein kinase
MVRNLSEAAVWQILFHLSAALALCHHGVEIHRILKSEEIDSYEILPRLISDPPTSLQTVASQHKTITWRSEQITFSMKENHEPIVHRDIKPRNST